MPPILEIAVIYMRLDTGAFMIQRLNDKHPVTYRSGNGGINTTLNSRNCAVLCAKEELFELPPWR